jgi:predicted dehydrogenase/threonine dehydrogenase-like Zn-dependent dehydrogenase
MPLGYCNVGRVMEVGAGVEGFAAGDRVASNGNHAEVVAVPKNLCAKVPDNVTDDEAAFTVIGAIALQGIRLVAPTLGETIVVAGLGLIGQITVQLLRANGCRVLGLDFDKRKLDLARQFGAETVDLSVGADPVAVAEQFTRGRGADGVIITASTKSNEPMQQAAHMCRKRGRIVLVGVTGLELSRADFYEKELTFQVSCSYGPGRYDPTYEQKGQDYPLGFVRWTEQRNLEAVLDMIAEGRLDVKPLISHRFALTEASQAYELILGTVSSLGVLLDFTSRNGRSETELRQRTVKLAPSSPAADARDNPGFGFIGSGSYAASMLIPAFKAAGARLVTVASNGGVSGLGAAQKFGFDATTTDTASVLTAKSIDAVVISTRHDTHARLVCQALEGGKDVFVEKPLAMQLSEVDDIVQAYEAAGKSRGQTPRLMVGFNRRFAPQVVKIKALLAGASGPKSFIMTVNAGAIPANHWTQDTGTGGGRIVGEACHFIDLLRFLAGAPIAQHAATFMQSASGDTATLNLAFADGSIGTIHYFANGNKAFPKERLEVFASGRILQLDNFRKLTAFSWPGFSKFHLWRQDKGQSACAAAFVNAVKSGASSPTPFEELIEVARVTIALAAEGARSA